MKTILKSTSLLILSILIVIGCEVLENSIEDENQSEVKQTEQSSDLSQIQIQPVNNENDEKISRKGNEKES